MRKHTPFKSDNGETGSWLKTDGIHDGIRDRKPGDGREKVDAWTSPTDSLGGIMKPYKVSGLAPKESYDSPGETHQNQSSRGEHELAVVAITYIELAQHLTGRCVQDIEINNTISPCARLASQDHRSVEKDGLISAESVGLNRLQTYRIARAKPPPDTPSATIQASKTCSEQSPPIPGKSFPFLVLYSLSTLSSSN